MWNTQELSLKGDVSLRLAEQENVQDILELWQAASRWMLEQGIDQWKPESFTIESVRKHLEDTELFVAVKDGRVIGTFSVQWSDEYHWGKRNSENFGYIHKLTVAKDSGAKGLGRQLLLAAEDYIRSTGRTAARLDCKGDNVSLNQYYQAAGYTFVDQVMLSGKWMTSLYEKKLC